MSAVLRKVAIRKKLLQLGGWLKKRSLEIFFIAVGLIYLAGATLIILVQFHILNPKY